MSTLLDLKALKDGMALSDCIVYLQSYKRKPYSDGKKFFITGSFVHQGDSVPFKIWDAPLVEALTANDIAGRVVKITGSVTTYQNTLEIKVLGIDINVEPQFTASMFLKSVDVPAVFNEFVTFVNTEISETGVAVLLGIFKEEKLFDRFKEEFAGTKMHDAQIGGLMHHTVKMLRIAKVVIENDPRLAALPNYKDMLYMGVILHDIGKIFEMHLGVYQENSFVTHRTLGVEMLVKYKGVIAQVFGEGFYYHLLAIIQGHHGEFGDKPTTLLAYLVHLIDMLDAMTTGCLDKVENNEVTQTGSGRTVYCSNYNLLV